MKGSKSSVIAVWGSPGSGKSTFSAILSRYLTRDKSKAIIISPDQTVPMMPVWFPNENIENSMSLGHILTSSEINNSIIAERVKLLKSYPYVGVLAYTSGDMPLSYPEAGYNKIVETIEVVSGMVDYVIIDCTSRITDLFTPAAIEFADVFGRSSWCQLQESTDTATFRRKIQIRFAPDFRRFRTSVLCA